MRKISAHTLTLTLALLLACAHIPARASEGAPDRDRLAARAWTLSAELRQDADRIVFLPALDRVEGFAATYFADRRNETVLKPALRRELLNDAAFREYILAVCARIDRELKDAAEELHRARGDARSAETLIESCREGRATVVDRHDLTSPERAVESIYQEIIVSNVAQRSAFRSLRKVGEAMRKIQPQGGISAH